MSPFYIGFIVGVWVGGALLVVAMGLTIIVKDRRRSRQLRPRQRDS